jgi:PAS domain S-box-containing protein
MNDGPAVPRPVNGRGPSLRDDAGLLPAAFRALPDPVWLKGPDGVYLACNALFCRLCNKDEAEIVGKTDEDVHDSPSLAGEYRRQDAEALATVRPLAFETEVTFLDDGHHELVEVLKTPLRDEAGRLLGILGVARDVSERKASEAMLSLQNRILARIASGAALQETLDALARGIEEQAPEMSASILLLDADGPAPGHGLTAFLSTPILDSQGKVLGTIALTSPSPGRPTARHRRLLEIATQAAAVAIARSREVEALRQSEARYRLLAESSSDVVWLFDLAADHFVYVSPSVSRQGGWSPEEITGPTPVDLLEPQASAANRSALAARIARFASGDESARSRTDEFEQLCRDGSTIPVEVSSTLVTDSAGHVTHLQGVTRDIRERRLGEATRRQLQEQAQLAQRIDSVVRLAGGIAHDFNNMLAVIQGYAALALEEIDPENPAHSGLREINMAARRAAGSVRQLLAFAQKQPAAPRPIDLNALLAQEQAAFAGSHAEGLELVFRPGEGVWPVRMDPVQIDQVLEALLANSREATGGRGTIVVETANVTLDEVFCGTHPGAVAGDYTLLTVRDDGCGMEKAVLDRVFEPFFTTKLPGDGPGLGLPTVYGIVKQNGGYIDIESAPGRGTGVRIRLPRFTGPLVAEGTPLGDGAGAASAMARTTGETVLLVEDEPAILNLGAKMLRRLGYDVLTANGPEAAMRLAEEHRGELHLLVTDVVMPGANGRDLAERLLTARPRMSLLYVSGYAADIVTRKGILGEGVRLLSKPFTLEELAGAVRAALEAGWPPLTVPPPVASVAAPPRILYIDDESALVELMTRTLKKLGYAVTAYADPLRAMAALEAEPQAFDVVVSDLSMPDLPGLDLARRVAEINPALPVVLVSGYVSAEAEKDARAAGARELLLKPGTVEELGTALDACIRRLAAKP